MSYFIGATENTFNISRIRRGQTAGCQETHALQKTGRKGHGRVEICAGNVDPAHSCFHRPFL